MPQRSLGGDLKVALRSKNRLGPPEPFCTALSSEDVAGETGLRLGRSGREFCRTFSALVHEDSCRAALFVIYIMNFGVTS